MTQTTPGRDVAMTLPDPDTLLLPAGDALLRPLRAADRDALHAAAQAEDIGAYTSIAWPFTPEAADRLIADAHRDWRAGAAARFAILNGSAGELVGTASLLHIYPERSDAEIGYWLGERGRGRGLARAAAVALRDWGFGALGLDRLHLLVDLDNAASHAVARAAGFLPVGERIWRHPTDPAKDGPVTEWALARTAWRAGQLQP